MEIGIKTDTGKLRNNNQDAYYANYPLFIVADGMGGTELEKLKVVWLLR